MLDQLFLKVAARLMLYLNTEYATKYPVQSGQQPVSKPLATVDLYNGQPEAFKMPEGGQVLPTTMPAIYIEFPPLNTTTASGGIQRADTSMRLHICQPNIAEQYQLKNSSAYSQNIALNQLVYLNQVNRAIHGWFPEGGVAISRFERTGIITDTDRMSISSHIMDYRIELQDITSSPQYNWTESTVQGFNVTGHIT